MSLEPAFWIAFQECAGREGMSVNALAERIDAARLRGEHEDLNLSAAIRLHVLADLQARLRALSE